MDLALGDLDGRNVDRNMLFLNRCKADAGSGTAEIVVGAYRAFGTPVAAKTETVYDAVGNVTEVRSPRYFDLNDAAGYQQARTTSTYTGRNLLASRTEAPGTAVAATVSLTYTPDRRLDTRTDARNNNWRSIWHACCGRPQAQIDPLNNGQISNNDYYGNVTHTATVANLANPATYSFHDPVDADTVREITTRYDARHRPTARTVWLVPRGVVDPNNPPIAGLDGVPPSDGLTTRYYYDDNLTDAQGLDGTFGSLTAGLGFGIGSNGSAVLLTNANGNRMLILRDGMNRSVRSVQLASDGTSISQLSIQHDALVDVAGFGLCVETTVVNGVGHQLKNRTDANGRVVQFVDNGIVVERRYDATNNLLAIVEPNSVQTSFEYDALNRRTAKIDPVGNRIETAYDSKGNVVREIDAQLNFTAFSYDVRDHRSSSTNRVDATTYWTHDAVGNLTSRTDANGNTTSYSYDASNRRLMEQFGDHVAGQTVGDPNYGIRTYEYDGGQLRRTVSQRGSSITNIYDLTGRRTSREYRAAGKLSTDPPDDTDSFTFDRVSRIVRATSERYANVVDFSYDDADRLSSESLTIGGQTYTVATIYNAANRVASTVMPDGAVVNRTYNSRELLASVDYNLQPVATFSFDNNRNETTRNLGNGLSVARTYRADQRLASVSTGGVGAFTYSYDANTNPTSISIAGALSQYGCGSQYDAENRLVIWNRVDGGRNLSWTLDGVGNSNLFSINSVAQTRQHTAANEVAAINSAPVVSDSVGNTIQGADGALYAWDLDERLTTASKQGVTTGYKYDALGRRVARTVADSSGSATTVLVYDRKKVVAEYDEYAPANQPLRKYVHGTYVDEPLLMIVGSAPTEVLYYYHRDALYSIIALSDGAGAVVERYAYDAYGNTTVFDGAGQPLFNQSSAVGNSFTFTGRWMEWEVSLLYYRARYYDSTMGRFLSRDPAGYMGGMNLYEYAASSPQAYVDPSGLWQSPPYITQIDNSPETCIRRLIEAGDYARMDFDDAFNYWLNHNPAAKRAWLEMPWYSWQDQFWPRHVLSQGCVGITQCWVGRTLYNDVKGDFKSCFTTLADAQRIRDAWNRANVCCKKKNVKGKPSKAVIFAFRWKEWNVPLGPNEKPRTMCPTCKCVIWNDTRPIRIGFDFGYYDECLDAFWHATRSEGPGGRILIDTPANFCKDKRSTVYCVTCESDTILK